VLYNAVDLIWFYIDFLCISGGIQDQQIVCSISPWNLLTSDICVTGDKFEICHHLIVCCGNLTEPTGLKSFRWLSGLVNWKDRLQTRFYRSTVLCL